MQNCATVIPCISRHFFYFESMPTIGSIEPYDGVENFKQYMQRVNFYFTANNVGSEFASTDVTKRDLALAQRKAVLLTVVEMLYCPTCVY